MKSIGDLIRPRWALAAPDSQIKPVVMARRQRRRALGAKPFAVQNFAGMR
jgi:hypothetical protein